MYEKFFKKMKNIYFLDFRPQSMQKSSKIVHFKCNHLLQEWQWNQSFFLTSYFFLHSLHLF